MLILVLILILILFLGCFLMLVLMFMLLLISLFCIWPYACISIRSIMVTKSAAEAILAGT